MGARFTDSSLVGAVFLDAKLANAEFSRTDISFADFRGATNANINSAHTQRNVLRPNGDLQGMQLQSGEELIVRDHMVGVTVLQAMALAPDATLEFWLQDHDWDGPINVAPNVTPNLDGNLSLAFDRGIDLPSMIGASFHLFNWNDRLTAGDAFESILVPPRTTWDLSALYTDGVVRLLQASLLGDSDGDFLVNITDLNNVRNNFGGSGLGDTDGDLDVDINDLNAVRNNFGNSLGAQSVPEPTAAPLLAIAAATLAFTKRRSIWRRGQLN
ncbi:MAG: pentapeptide repeat-containing protein [Planctomycetia bacterium]|nr:pentapeptide repeat-containing protein [Planctomycetia bacterium]